MFVPLGVDCCFGQIIGEKEKRKKGAEDKMKHQIDRISKMTIIIYESTFFLSFFPFFILFSFFSSYFFSEWKRKEFSV